MLPISFLRMSSAVVWLASGVSAAALALLTRLPLTTILSSVVAPSACDAASCASAGPASGRREMAVHRSSAECVREMDIKYPQVGARMGHGVRRHAALAAAAETVLIVTGEPISED